MTGLNKKTSTVGKWVTKYSPQILTGASLAGLVLTVAVSGKAAIKANDILNQSPLPEERLPRLKESVRLTWRVWLPTVTVVGVTATSILSAQSIHQSRYAALSSVYAITDSTLKEYQDKVRSFLGEKKEKSMRDELMQEKIDKKPMREELVIFTGHGDHLCHDSLSGRYFKTDIEKVRKSVNKMNQQILHENWVSLNDLYYSLGLKEIDLGDMVGWNTDKLIDIEYTSALTPAGDPCLVLDYSNSLPSPGYYG